MEGEEEEAEEGGRRTLERLEEREESGLRVGGERHRRPEKKGLEKEGEPTVLRGGDNGGREVTKERQ